MTDAERVLSLLIHDLRTPLGVAHGYLRLIRSDKLPTPDDRDRALASTQEALATISRLCAEASAFVAGELEQTGRAPATALVERVASALSARGVPLTSAEPASGQATVGTSLDRAGDAIAALLGTGAKKGLAATALVQPVDGELRFACGPTPAPDPAALAGEGTPFDPWAASQGLTVVLAHRLLIGLGGRAWISGDGRTVALSVRMETA
jgi:hypothetical protein